MLSSVEEGLQPFFCAELLMLLLGIGLDNNSGTKEFGLEIYIFFVFCSLGIKTKKKVCKIKFTVLYLRPLHLQFFSFLTVVLSPSYLATLFFSWLLHFLPPWAAREGKKKKRKLRNKFFPSSHLALPVARVSCLGTRLHFDSTVAVQTAWGKGNS